MKSREIYNARKTENHTIETNKHRTLSSASENAKDKISKHYTLSSVPENVKDTMTKKQKLSNFADFFNADEKRHELKNDRKILEN